MGLSSGRSNTRELDEFATALAEDLGCGFPPKLEAIHPGAKHQLEVITEGLTARAVRFHKEHKLGITGRPSSPTCSALEALPARIS